ncbi:MAG: hypothetical protein JHC95_16630 [Solirubrobacteraceae bacterium]|nr:hypothetical protein [Solirubrobacteraceae bacterium]
MSSQPTSLVGRTQETKRVAHAVSVGRPVLIVGEPGVGKTALARGGARAANPPRIWEGGGIATLDWVSYLPYRRAMDLDLPNGEASVVADFLADNADEGVFVVDDLQWVDDDTITATLLLAERVPVIAATRPMPRGQDVRTRLAEAGFEVIELAPLTEEDAADLAAAQNPALTELDARSVARRAGGNPLLIEGLAHAGEHTTELAFALRARLAELSEPARSALNRVAVLERPARLDIDAADLEQLLDMGLVTSTHEGIQVRHSLIADAVLEELSPEALREAHRAVGQRLDDPGEAARHWAAAGDLAQARALALRAAQTADRPVERERCAALAATCLDGAARDAELVVAMARLAALGDFVSVVDLGRHITPGSVHEPEAWRLRARGLFETQASEAAANALASGRAAALRRQDDAGIARLRITTAYHDLWSMEYDTATTIDAIQSAREHGVADAEMHVQAAAALAPAPERRTQALAVELAQRGNELAGVEGHAWADQESWAVTATALTNLGRAAEAREATRLGEIEMRARGYHASVARIGARRADLLVFDCVYDVVIELTDALLARPGLLGGNWDTAVWSRALALNDVGAFDTADALLAELEGRVSRDGMFNVAWIGAEALLTRGDPWAATPLAQTSVHMTRKAAIMRPQAAATLTRSQFECGVPLVAETLEIDSIAARPYNAEIRGLEALQAGAGTEAVERFRTAIAQNGWRRHALRCRLGLAEALDLVDPEQATAHFHELVTDLRDVGWTTLLHRVEPLVDAPPGGRRLRPSAPPAPGGLTKREHAVLTLVADGLTSRAIADRLGISQATVETHVRAAKRKLGARTRAEAAASVKPASASR